MWSIAKDDEREHQNATLIDLQHDVHRIFAIENCGNTCFLTSPGLASSNITEENCWNDGKSMLSFDNMVVADKKMYLICYDFNGEQIYALVLSFHHTYRITVHS